MNFIIAQFALIAFNITNAFIDAYRILDKKNIAHAINFMAYFLWTAACVAIFDINFSFWELLVFFISAFANRQISFDIPLNLRRGLPWYYQSTAMPPKALMDRIERYFFGSGVHVGEDITWFYVSLWCLCVNLKIWLL